MLLDTHAWIWYLSQPELISKKAKKTLDKARNNDQLCISSISVWEIAMLVKKNRLQFNIDVEDWIAKSETLPFFKFLPITNRIALKSVSLPEPLHSDSADRIIIATALIEGMPIITKDKKIIDYSEVETIW